MMNKQQRIVLIACTARKLPYRAKAEEIYTSPLFRHSLAYARTLNPDQIFILSALHHLLPLDQEIEPYNVTLSLIPKSKHKPGLKVLNTAEKAAWGVRVLEQLKTVADLQQDNFIILAGQEYIRPIHNHIVHLTDVLQGKGLFERVAYLKQLTHDSSITPAF